MLSINKLLLPVASALLVLGAFVASLADTLDDASPPDEVNSKALWTTGSISSHKGFQHYFRLEFELLTNQAMILGDYHPNDEESRLKLQLKALQIELAYTCNLRRIMLDSVRNINITTTSNITTNLTTCGGSERICAVDGKQKQSKSGKILSKIEKTISRATWLRWVASQSSKGGIPVKKQEHHGYNFDWVDENGSFGLYDELNCYDHAAVQYKRLYTDDDWNTLWQKFQDASLYPYPIPNPSKRVYYTAYSDGRGRGNFASRNIKQGEMIYNGYKNAAFFQEGESFKRFVALLSKEAACDVLEWAFMQDLTNDGNAVLCLDMDGGALFNDGSPYHNIECKERSSLNKYANREIRKGEELTEFYEDFSKTEINL
ncbi:hypothetical protein ACHAXM_002342 [Skeletonema potamos]|jgi:hypothetical protein